MSIESKLHMFAHEYRMTESGSWLGDFLWYDIPIEFKKLKNDVVGYYAFGKIVLMEVLGAEVIFDIYIHELRHAWQRQKHPFRYFIGKLYRPLIEEDADREELKALKWLNDERNNNGQY